MTVEHSSLSEFTTETSRHVFVSSFNRGWGKVLRKTVAQNLVELLS